MQCLFYIISRQVYQVLRHRRYLKLQKAVYKWNCTVLDRVCFPDSEQKSFQRQNFQQKSNNRNNFVEMVQKLVKENVAQVYTIDHEGKSVASIIMIQDLVKKAAYYWMAGADKEYLSTGLNQLLMIQVIQKYQKADFESFDLVGADTESIARYKSTFNFPLIPIYSASKERGLVQAGLIIKRIMKKSR